MLQFLTEGITTTAENTSTFKNVEKIRKSCTKKATFRWLLTKNKQTKAKNHWSELHFPRQCFILARFDKF